MSDFQKLPIGAKPHWFVYTARIEELSKAVARYANFLTCSVTVENDKQIYETIENYIDEIKLLIKLERKLLSIWENKE